MCLNETSFFLLVSKEFSLSLRNFHFFDIQKLKESLDFPCQGSTNIDTLIVGTLELSRCYLAGMGKQPLTGMISSYQDYSRNSDLASGLMGFEMPTTALATCLLLLMKQKSLLVQDLETESSLQLPACKSASFLHFCLDTE